MSKILKNRVGYLSASPRSSTHPEADNSGPRTHMLSFIKAFQNLGHDVKTFIVGDRMPKKWTQKGSKRAVSSNNFFRSLVVDLVRISLAYVNTRKAWQEIGDQVDWVYERYASFAAIGRIFKQHGKVWILETNGPFFYEAKTERKSMVLTGLARQQEVRAYRDCDILVCITHALKDILVNELGISPEKIVIVPNGVDVNYFNPQNHQPQRLFSNFTIGFVGSLPPWQGIDLLLEVISELVAAGKDISLVVVGDGIMYQEWTNLAHQLGLKDRVSFVGQKRWSEVPSYLAGFDVAYTGQTKMKVGKMYHSPLKLYEYMSMARPVIASAFEDAQRVIKEGETGFLFQPGDKADLKRVLLQAYENKENLLTIGQQARKEMVENNSWLKRVEKMKIEIENILSANNN